MSTFPCCVCNQGQHPVRTTRFGRAAVCDPCLKVAEEHADDERDMELEARRDAEAIERSDGMLRTWGAR